MSAAAHRVFFALWPDAESAGHLAALGQALAGRGGRPVRAASLHLTLRFIGSVSAADLARIESVAGGVRGAAFELTLDELGFWPRGGILWAGCRRAPGALRDLARALDEALERAGVASGGHRHPGFAPHVTLARHVRGGNLPRLASPLRWHVGRFVLAESHLHPAAASYRELAGFPLAGAAG